MNRESQFLGIFMSFDEIEGRIFYDSILSCFCFVMILNGFSRKYFKIRILWIPRVVHKKCTNDFFLDCVTI